MDQKEEKQQSEIEAESEPEESEAILDEIASDDHLKLITLRTPLTKILREKVKCIEQYDVIQGALDFNAYAIHQLNSLG